jgi:hypothetical protein
MGSNTTHATLFPAQSRLGEARVGEVRPTKIRLCEVRVSEIRLSKIRNDPALLILSYSKLRLLAESRRDAIYVCHEQETVGQDFAGMSFSGRPG